MLEIKVRNKALMQWLLTHMYIESESPLKSQPRELETSEKNEDVDTPLLLYYFNSELVSVMVRLSYICRPSAVGIP